MRCIDAYRSALRESSTFLYSIDPRTYVAEIFDPVTLEKGRGVDAWVILQSVFDSETGSTSFACCKWCPDKVFYSESCLHELALNGSDVLRQTPASAYDNPTAIAFRWTPSTASEPSLILYCSMSAKSEPAIVSYNGFYSNAGVWLGDHEHHLGHDTEADSDELEKNREKFQLHFTDLRAKADKNSLHDLYDERSISYKPVPPPR
ncbi:hypothetical protein BKA62DRAFT_779391 [Auriculariales sp. MPI-PUGE-AT-0066]|nr:hypothetical protein BKA62DRAFT_779391 [Auriculariales sp. MPI-PUGE-AT-0066]